MKILTILLLNASPVMIHAQPQRLDLFIGTYTHTGKSEGIHVYDFDTTTGAATLKSVVKAENPSFLAISSDRKHVYAVNENGDGKGAVSAYAYDGSVGRLTLLNTRLTQSAGPCHVAINHGVSHAFVSNYSGGSLSVFSIHKDGKLGELVQLIQYEGSGPDKNRQQAPHIHSAFFSPDEKTVYVQDLGTDMINIYDYHPEHADKPLTPAAQPVIKSAPGGGPRHIAQSANGQFIYLVQEMTAQVMVYGQEEDRWVSIQEIAMNESGFTGKDGAADIKLSPDGKFLYASNRGDANTLAIYRVNTADGKLTKVANQSVLGSGPRNFTMTPDSKYLLVANQNTDEVVVFARDANTGLLEDTGNRIAIGAPVCLVF